VLGELQRSYADAVLGGNEVEAERVVRDAIEAGVPEAVIDDVIITPVLRLVGDLWSTGDLPVEDGNRATEISIRVLTLQREAFRAAARRAARRILLAGPEGELHVLGLDMVGSVLVHAGYDVRHLGPDVATARLVEAVAELRPAILGLTVTMPDTAALIPETIAAVREAEPALGVVIGGQSASHRMCTSPGVAICQHVTDALETTDALLHRAPLN
jgi:5-methyltetrahydrofolate--homocysteine methyltransferase